MTELIHHHKYVALYEQQKEKKWLQKTGTGTVDRVGKTVGILGYGSIGRQGE
jgi:phosphoglycerate dehydrogenase-like enzyme